MALEEIIDLHTSKEYIVYTMGFSPGFPYLGGLDSKLDVPRLKKPRIKVEKGSVGITGNQTGIYPIESPGGWNIIGRTPLELFNSTSDSPTLLKPGDKVKLEMFQSRLANILVVNFETDAVLEITILGPKLVFLESVVIALTGADLTANLDGEYIPRWEPIKVEKGSGLSFGECRNGARAYLSVSGNGFDVPLVMGSRSTYLQGNFGGYDGRSLQKEDVLNSVSDTHKPETKMMPSGFVQPDYSEIKKIRIVLGII